MSTTTLGRGGEARALVYLEELGYQLLRKNYRNGPREIDLIMQTGCTVVFVEVKARSGTGYGTPAEFVTPAKQHLLTLAAQAYPELTITQGVPALSIISSCLTAGDGNQATSDPFTVASGERNLDLNLGYVLREGEAMPAQVVPGAVQNWVK